MWGAIALQIPFLNLPLSNDEGGYLFVAEQWGLDLGEVYGGQWVDRPPLLLVIFKIVSWVGGSESAVRVTAMFFTALAVLAARWVGHSINLTRGAVVAALIATGIGSNYWLDGYELTGEKIGGALVLVSCALTLEAWQGTRSAQLSMLAAFGAGFAASCAFLVKQDFVDAAIFAAVLLLLHVRTHWHLLVTGAAGVVAPLGLTGLWAASPWGPGVGPLWSAVVTFRGKASAVLATTGTTATGERAHDLVVLGLISGAVVVAVCFVAGALQLRGEWRLSVAIAAMLGYDVLAIVLGGSYWAHYMLGLVAPLAIAAAFASRATRSQIAVQWVAGLVAACALTAAIGGLVRIHEGGIPRRDDEVIADWLKDASHPEDTVFVAYGEPDILATSGLGTPYPYSWSLPIRVRDPDLTHLTALLTTPAAPTWLVEVGDFDWWGLDTPAFHRMREVRYTLVDNICGKDIYLRVDEPRELPPSPTCD